MRSSGKKRALDDDVAEAAEEAAEKKRKFDQVLDGMGKLSTGYLTKHAADNMQL